jgi:uncharacterized cupin superfamily protein
MGDFSVGHVEDFESIEGSGGATWHLARRSLDAKAFGFNVVDIPAGSAIVEHDETESGQEEVFMTLEGEAVFLIDGEEHPAPAGTFARFAPEVKRNVLNQSEDPVRVLLIGVPASSGFEPQSWA